MLKYSNNHVPSVRSNTVTRKRCSWMIALLSSLLIVCCVWGAVSVTALDTANRLLDFRDPDGIETTLPQGDVVSALLGDIPAAEVDYLNAHSGYVLMTSSIPADRMEAYMLNGTVTLLAYEYTYTTKDGVTVTWTPFFAENLSTDEGMVDLILDEELSLYRATLAGKSGDEIKVYYATLLTVSEDMALEMVNEAPEAAKALMDAMKSYEAALAVWTAEHRAYEAYRVSYAEWKAAADAYDAYVAQKKLYEDWCADYDVKKAAMDDYLARLDAYETWTQYCIDLKAYEDYMAQIEVLPSLKAEYEEKKVLSMSHMTVMDRMFLVSEISGYSFVRILNSGAADYVVNNKTMLKNLSGVDPKDVDKSVAATIMLRGYISGMTDENGQTVYIGYENLTDPEDKYNYYITYKEEITAYLEDLYTGMVSLAEVPLVLKEIEGRGGLDIYRQFLGNLYVQWALMEDTATLDTDIVHLDAPLYELIEPELVLPDENNAAPLEEYPTPPTASEDIPAVPYPGEAPPEAEHPGDMPEAVPDEKDKPAKPEKVDEAGDPPAEVTDPGNAPVAPMMSDVEKGLYEAALRGELSPRAKEDLPTGGQISVMTESITKVASSKYVKITVMSYKGSMVSSKFMSVGTLLSEKLTNPGNPDDPHLAFVGWSLRATPLPSSPDEVYDVMKNDIALTDMTVYPVYAYRHMPGAEATCTSDQVCTICDAILVPALPHDDDVVITPPTCTVNGYMTSTCRRCGDQRVTQTDVATGHTAGAAATCTEDQTCTVCGVVISEKLGHSYEATVTAPTCTEWGYRILVCSLCGDEQRERNAQPLGHSLGEWVIDTEPTWDTPGLQHAVCTVCGHCEEELIPKKEMDPNCHVPGAEATCTTDQICTLCGMVLVKALEHDYQVSVVEPSCDHEGYTAHTCSRCGDEYRDGHTEMIDHTPSDVNLCEEDRCCLVCGKVLEQRVGHDYQSAVTPPTCTEEGYTTHTCNRCHDIYTDSKTEPWGHASDKEATCTEDQICTVCGAVMKEMLGHDYGETVTPPTCTAEGYTTYVCSRCDDTYEDAKTDPLGHASDTEVTCTEDQICRVCGAVMAEKLGHHESETVVPPTCTEGGMTVHFCDRCEDRYETDPTEPLGHSYGDWIVDVEPGVGKDGHRYRECALCEQREEEVLEAETDTEDDSREADTQPMGTLPEVKWYAKLLGAFGLPGLVSIAGVTLGSGTAGIVILIMRRKRKLKKQA